MRLIDYINVIKIFASEDPDLQHSEENNAVLTVSYEEAVSLLKEIPDRMVLLLPPYGKHVYHNAGQGNVWIKEGLVMAVQYVEGYDMTTRVEVQTKAEGVLDRLYSFFYNQRGTELLYGFDPTSWESDTIGPVGANHYGYFAEFLIKDGVIL